MIQGGVEAHATALENIYEAVIAKLTPQFQPIQSSVYLLSAGHSNM